MLLKLSHSLPSALVLLAVAAPLSAHAQTTHPPAIPTTTTLACGPPTDIAPGSTIPLIATVVSSDGTPTGRVNFVQDNVAIGSVSLASGTASQNAVAYAGEDTFLVTFPEQNGYATSSATCVVDVGAMSFHSDSNPALAYSTITFIANVETQPFPGGDFTITFNGGPPIEFNGGARNPAVAFYTTDTLTPGTYTVTATFTPFDGSTPDVATITQVVTAPTGDFVLNAYPPVVTARAGLAVTDLISATSINDFHGPVSFTCSLPQIVAYTCTLTPPNVQLILNDYGASTVTLAPTKVPTVPGSSQSHLHDTPRIILASLLPFSLLTFAAFAIRRRRTHLRSLLTLAVLTLLAFSTTACGKDVFFAATPPGTYPVTITATGTTPGESPITHTLTITLNITQ